MKSKYSALPYYVWMALFTIAPLILVLVFAFTDNNGAFTIENISQVGEYTNVLVRSVWLAAVATVICLLIAYPLAYIMSRLGPSKQRTMVMLIMLPMWMNFLLRTYAWMTILENNGLLNRFFGLFGVGPFDMINTQGAVVLGMVYNYLPFMILPLYTIMVKIDNRVIEAAQDLGASPLKVASSVVLPLSVPGISTGITMVFVPAVSTFIISRMLGGGGNLLIGDLIDLQFLGNAYNPHLGSAISLVLMVIILLCMSVMNQFGEEEEREGMLI
ncbi:MAG: ABC transporter permease [Oscillospiraceae bacterium]|nr:ABC transporter permease [Oscillospiraceae bacterium]